MMNFLTEPVPHEEARRMIADKPAVAREVFDQLPIELRGRAFTITAIEDFDVLQAVRDEIAKLPAGADWNKVKREIVAKISPWFDADAADRRAKLLLNHHARASYAATNARVLDGMKDVFTHRMYRSSRLSKEPRVSHQALDGLILPATHPFWEKHTPPWEWGCQCMDPIPMTAEEADEEAARDSGRGEEAKQVAGPEQLAALENGTLVRGPGAVHDVKTPREQGGSYEFDWRSTTLPFEEIRQRWDEDVARGFEEWAEKIPMEGGSTLLAHLTGLAPGGGRQRTVARAATFAEALANSGLAQKAAWERADLANLRAAMRVENPVSAEEKLAGMVGVRSQGEITGKEIKRAMQDSLDLLPRELAETLPPVEVHVVDKLAGNRRGEYRPSGAGAPRVRVSLEALKGLKGEARRRELRRILAHENMHWIHTEARGPAADAYRAAIRSHYAARTAGDIELPDGEGGIFRADQWWALSAGREYKDENGRAGGLEIPARYFELWETPDKLMLYADQRHPDANAFRETFSLVQTIFDAKP